MSSTNRKDWDPSTKKDTLACVALLVTAVTILISGAINVHLQNASQSQQGEARRV